jgi:transcriptional regulator with XRE-family HTH domain
VKIGEKVRKFRQQVKLSQGRFAAAIGMSQAFVSLLETGAIRPSAAVVTRIENAMKIIREAERAADDARKRVFAEARGSSDRG